MTRVAIVGVGLTPLRPTTPELSWKELMYEAASKAYADADLDPRKEIGSFVTCAEDYWEGFGIFDEFVPDQLGATLRPTCTVSGDGILGLAQAAMQIQSGLFDVVAVEAHSKASDLLTYNHVVQHALDPVLNKPLRGHPHYLAGLEMASFLARSRNTASDCAGVVAKNRGNAMLNPLAAYPTRVTAEDANASPPAFDPLRELDQAALADGGAVLVLASERKARKFARTPVWIRGYGWGNDSPNLETRDWTTAKYTELAAAAAYRMARVTKPAAAIDVAEVDDRFSYKELEHLEAAGLASRGGAGKAVRRGDFDRGGRLPVNPSGGSLGCGYALEAAGLYRVGEVALQLRGEAGQRQVDGARTGIAVSWRGIPTATGAVAVLGVGR